MSSDNNTPSSVQAALEAWLANHEPDETGSSLKTTDAIIRELDDMVEVTPQQVADTMMQHGYTIVWHPSGRHGWAMRLLV